jgi:hypothetical protein
LNSKEEQEKLNISFSRIKKFIWGYWIETKWYSWENYSEEINFYELKWTEETNDENLRNKIKDTIEPAVFVDWDIEKTAKIIVYKFVEKTKIVDNKNKKLDYIFWIIFLSLSFVELFLLLYFF